MPELEALLHLAVEAAEGAGALLKRREDEARVTVEHKSSLTDMVTEMDRAAEAFVVKRLHGARPNDGFLGEEGSLRSGSSGVRWIIDPLDGTTNYLYGFPAYTVSIAAEVDGAPAVGAVHDPSHGETFTAIAGRGAWCNGRLLSVAGATTLATALVATGFSYVAERRAWQAEVLARVMPSVRDVRRAGAASLDLCWLAAGRVDVYYERGLQPWDYAAGALVAAEAGAEVTDLDGGPPSTAITIAAAPTIAADFRALLADAEAGVGAP